MMRTLAKLLVVLALFAVTVVAALGAVDPELDIPLAADYRGPTAAAGFVLFVACVLAGRRKPAVAPHTERRTQFGLSAVDPAVAEQHMAAWERPAQPSRYYAPPPPPPPYHAHAYPVAPSSPPIMPPTWFDVMPAMPTAAPYQATLEQAAAGTTTIGYAPQPPSSYDDTPLFVRPEFDDDGATQFQPSYQRYVEEQHEAHQRLARGSQPPRTRPHADELLDVTHAYRKR